MSCVTCHMSFVLCHMSFVLCQLSHDIIISQLVKLGTWNFKTISPPPCVTCSMSCVKCHILLSFLLFLLFICGASWWRVCYQWGLPHLVYINQATVQLQPVSRRHTRGEFDARMDWLTDWWMFVCSKEREAEAHNTVCYLLVWLEQLYNCITDTPSNNINKFMRI